MFAIDQPSARSGSIQFESRQGPNTMQTRVDGYQAKYVLRFLQAPADFNLRLVVIALARCPPSPTSSPAVHLFYARPPPRVDDCSRLFTDHITQISTSSPK